MSVAPQEAALLSKIADENRADILDRYGLTRDYFTAGPTRAAAEFVRSYSAQNQGRAPSYAAILSAVPGFLYVPGVTDTYEYLASAIKERRAQLDTTAYFGGGEIKALFDRIGRDITYADFADSLTDRLAEFKRTAAVKRMPGLDIAEAGDWFIAEYEARRAGKSHRIWRSKFPSVNKALGGGYYSSNMYVFYARSGRGKSVITQEEELSFASQGATVLTWALEMGRYERMARGLSSISARSGLATATISGVDYSAGFDNRALQAGALDADYTARMTEFVRELPSHLAPGRVIVRATDDPGFNDRSLRALRADIIETGADVVIVDPFYYLDYEANTSKTAGGDAAATSRKLRLLAGELGVLIIAITQADEDAAEKDKAGVRELKPPKRAEVKKTKALLEDAAALIGLDTLAHEGRGVIEIGKGRSGGEDTRVEIVYLPNYGIVREPDLADQAAQFVDTF